MSATNADIEARRLVLQAKLDSGKSQLERNKLGQFATPTALACDIVAHSVHLLPETEPIRFLDPALGTGSFYSALRATTAPGRIADAAGFELDVHYGIPAKGLWTGAPLRILLRDFTTATPPRGSAGANLLVCNPPYVRHHHLERNEKLRLQDASEISCGVRIAGLAGLYAYFLALSHKWMSEGGIAAWLIPSEFMDVNYGKAVKDYLLQKVHLLRIHRFDPSDVQFGDALVSSAVVWFKKEIPPLRHDVQFTFGGPLATPRAQKFVSTSSLSMEAKWTRFPTAEVRSLNTGPKLRDYFKVQRGLATGDNRFFIMTAEEAAKRRLPKQFLRPILPSPRYLPECEVQSDATGMPLISRPQFLLDCRLPESEVRARHPALWAYLQTGVPDVSERYLCAHRSPWYCQEERPAAQFVCTYMGRSNGRNGTPFRFILNHSQATVANVYLILYPKPVLQQALARDAALARKVWEILSSILPGDLLDEGRVYGGGLYKMEPKELMNVGADAISTLVDGVVSGPRASPDLLEGQAVGVG